jgi:hypothetical protein
MRKPIALLILIFVFIPLVFSAMTLIAIRPWVLDRGFYERIVSDERIYSSLFIGRVSNQYHLEMFTVENQLPVPALNASLSEVVTPDYLRTQAIKLVDDTFDLIDGRIARFEATLDITPLKTALAGEAGERFANTLAAALPACEVGQTQIAPGGTLARCIPADSSVNETAAQITEALPAALTAMPDRILLNAQSEANRSPHYFDWFWVGNFRALLDGIIVITVLLTLAAAWIGAWLGSDDLRGRLKWLSSAIFFLSSLFIISALAMTSSVITAMLRSEMNFAFWDQGQLSAPFQQGVTDIVIPLVQQIGSGFLMVGVAGFVIAFVLLVRSWMVTSSKRHSGKIVQIPTQVA